MHDVGAVTGHLHGHPLLAFRLSTEPHLLKERRHLCTRKLDTDQVAALADAHRALCGCEGGSLYTVYLNALDCCSRFRHRGAEDVHCHLHGTLVSAGRVQQDISRTGRHPRAFAIDDRRERADLVFCIDNEREEREVPDDLCIVPSLWVVGEDLFHGEFPVIIERDKLPAAR